MADTGADAELERLDRIIEEQKRVLSSLPPLRSLAGNLEAMQAKAKLLKEHGDTVAKREILLESRRVAEVLRAHEELHPPASEECPICFDSIRLTDSGACTSLACCGGCVCRNCADLNKIKICPLCRSEFPESAVASFRSVLKTAKRGTSLAQCAVGQMYLTGRGVPADISKAMHWFQLSADQQNPVALRCLGTIYFEGSNGIPENQSMAKQFLKAAADLGNCDAQDTLGLMYHNEDDEVEAARYCTLALSQHSREETMASAFVLGMLFGQGGGGLNASLQLAKYYLEVAADGNQLGSKHWLARSLLGLSLKQYEKHMTIPGHSCIPRILALLRQDAASDDGYYARTSAEFIDDLVNQYQSSCSNCFKDAHLVSGPLQRCVRCKASWYCGKSCQKMHWRAGHKRDCVERG